MSTGTIQSAYDSAARIIRTKGEGVWSVETIDRHLVHQAKIIATARSVRPTVNILSDLRDAAVQPEGIAAKILAFTKHVYRPGDRIAIVVSSSLLKLQMRRTVLNDDTEIFLSPAAAETWLRAYDDAPCIRQVRGDAATSPRI